MAEAHGPMTPPSRPARLHDVARVAGVHVSTVSRVINNNALTVRPETRERILEVARELQYRPNAYGRGLKLASTGTLGLLVPSLRNPVNSPVIRAAFDRAWQRNFVVLLAEDEGYNESAPEAYARLVHEGRIDGMLIQSARLGDEHLELFVSGAVPCVFMDRRHPGSGRNVSMLDGEAGGLAADHFLTLGHRALAHLAGPDDLDTVVRRRDGFVGRAREAGIEPTVVATALREDAGYEGMHRLLGQERPPTAVYIANINQALGAVAAVRESGRSAPRDISLLCHDDDPVCVYLDPPLSTVRMPLLELGAASVDALIEQIEGGRAKDIVIPAAPELILRHSTGPAAPRCGSDPSTPANGRV